jgi:ribonuclease D
VGVRDGVPEISIACLPDREDQEAGVTGFMTATSVKETKLKIYEGDISDEALKQYLAQTFVTVDTETRGLNVRRDRLCLVQISDKDGNVSLVRFRDRTKLPIEHETNLKKLLEAKNVLKVFHFARFDLAVLRYYLNAKTKPIWCTKIASKLVRTYSDRHSLKDLGRELLGLEMDKTDQTSDWAKEDLTESQLDYAANDVKLLVPIYDQMRQMVERENRTELAQRLFDFVEVVVELDMMGFANIFEH